MIYEERDTYSCGEIANLLNKSADWFRQHRLELHARGLPEPLNRPGHRRWDRDAIDRWVASRYVGIPKGMPILARPEAHP